jgi:hypothetical protein
MERLGLSPAEAASQLAELAVATGVPLAEMAAAVLSPAGMTPARPPWRYGCSKRTARWRCSARSACPDARPAGGGASRRSSSVRPSEWPPGSADLLWTQAVRTARGSSWRSDPVQRGTPSLVGIGGDCENQCGYENRPLKAVSPVSNPVGATEVVAGHGPGRRLRWRSLPDEPRWRWPASREPSRAARLGYATRTSRRTGRSSAMATDRQKEAVRRNIGKARQA